MRRMGVVVLVGLLVVGVVIEASAQAGTGPTLLYSSVLNGVKIEQDTGELYLYQIQVANLPPPTGAGYYPYNPDTGGKFWATLLTSSGAQIARFDFSAQRIEDPFWLVQEYKLTDSRTGQQSANGRFPVTPGVYTLNFYVEGTQISTFTFGVSSLTDNAGQKGWFLDGAWEDWAYLFYQGANPQEGLTWKVWLRNKMVNVPRSARVSVEIIQDSDGHVMFESRMQGERLLQNYWVRQEFPLQWPADSAQPGLTVVAQNLLDNDGDYTVRVAIEGQEYATWKFAVVNGQLSRGPRTDPATADPLLFIGGGTDAWWYEREGAPALVVPTTGATTGGGTATGDAPATGGTQTGGAQTGGGQAAVTGAVTEVIAGATPIQVNGITLVPMRAIFEWLGAEVKYIPQALSIIANKNDDIIVLMRLDETEATVNAKKVPMGIMPQQRDGVTYVPLRFVAESFGATVGYDAGTGTITITDGERVGLIR